MGLVEINGKYGGTIVSPGQYLICNKDPLMKVVPGQHNFASKIINYQIGKELWR